MYWQQKKNKKWKAYLLLFNLKPRKSGFFYD
jgi:hypothetical protein